MAFNNLGLQEPSTITARVATVTIQRGSTLEHQEILVLGDPTSSLAVAQVTNAAPSTSAYGLAVRQVDAVQSAQSGTWTVRANLSSTGADNPVSAAQSGSWAVRSNLSSTSTDNPVSAAQAGNWTVRATLSSTNTDNPVSVPGKVSVINSSAADLLVSAAQSGSWTVRSNLSSTSADNPVNAAQVGSWTVRANLSSTSTDNPVNAAQAGSWTVRANLSSTSADNPVTATLNLGGLQSSAVTNSNSSALLVRVVGGVSSAVDFPVRAVLSSTSADNPVTATLNLGGLQSSAVTNSNSSALLVRVIGGVSSAADFPVRAILSSTQTDNLVTARQGIGNSSGADAWITAVVDSSNAIVKPGDSVNRAVRVNVVAGSAAGSTVVTVAQMLDSSGGSITAGDSVNQALRVNVVAGSAAGSTIVTVSTVQGKVAVVNSSAADLLMSAVQSGAWTVRANLSSTSADNPVSAAQSGNWTVRATLSSTSADNPVSAAQTGTWTVNLGTNLQSTSAPSSNSSGLIVRQVLDALQTVNSTNAFASTSFTVQSSVAGIRTYVTGYSILTTNAGPIKVGFYDGSSLLWPIRLAAVSSAISGVNLAVAPPGYLFRGSAANAMTVQTPSSQAGVTVAISYFQAP